MSFIIMQLSLTYYSLGVTISLWKIWFENDTLRQINFFLFLIPHDKMYIAKLLVRSRHHIWILSDSNVIRTHNHLVRKRTLNHLAKLAKWLSLLWVLICTVHLTVGYCHVIY